MKDNDSAPYSIFGIRVKTLIIVLLFAACLLVVVNRSEMESLLQTTTIDGVQDSTPAGQNGPQPGAPHLEVDEEMLSRAMQEVQVEKLSQLESQNSSTPTDRFFYVIELVSGGDLEGIDLKIEPDHVILESEGGTETTISRTAIKKIHRFKLPPSQESQPN